MDLLTKDGDGKFYVHLGTTTEAELAQLRDAIAEALAKDGNGQGGAK
jgi:hypothetical protein